MALKPKPTAPLADLPIKPTGKVTFGETTGALYRELFQPVSEGLKYYSQQEFDPKTRANVETYIKENGLSGFDASYMRKYGALNEKTFIHSKNYIAQRNKDKEIISRSKGTSLFIGDPFLHAGIVTLPFGAFTFATRVGQATGKLTAAGFTKEAAEQAVLKFGDEGALEVATFAPSRVNRLGPLARDTMGLVTTRQTAAPKPASLLNKSLRITGTPTRVDSARLAALDAAVVDGSLSIIEVANELGAGEKDPMKVLAQAALVNAITIGAAGTLGYAVGKSPIVDKRPSVAKQRPQIISERSNEVVSSMLETPAANSPSGEISFSAPWFFNSWFVKALPTGLRSVVRSTKLPDWSKEEFLGAFGDNGFPTIANQMGKSHGNSAAVNANRRQADWFEATEVLDEAYGELYGSSTKVLDIPVGDLTKRIRKTLGSDQVTLGDWYEHIGRLIIDDVPMSSLSGAEQRAVSKTREFFDKYKVDLEEVGLLKKKNSDILYETVGKDTDTLVDMASTVDSIVVFATKKAQDQLPIVEAQVKAKNKILSDLASTQKARGLNENQLKLQKTIEDEISELNAVRADLESSITAFSKIDTIDDMFSVARGFKTASTKQLKSLDNIENAMSQIAARVRNAEETMEFFRSKGMDSESPYLFRVYNRPKIAQNREAFEQILRDWFTENPEFVVRKEDGMFEIQKFDTSPKAIAKRATQTVNNILGETDEDVVDALFTGFGKSGPLSSRRLNIPNSLVKEFIATDVKQLMIAYTSRVAPKIEFHKKFRNPETGRLMSLEERFDYLRDRLRRDGVDEDTINMYLKDYKSAYDRTIGTPLKRPDAIDTRIADGLRTAASWAFLRTSGIAALGDASSLFMDHELKTLGKAFSGLLDQNSENLFKMTKRELQLSGEVLEIAKGMSHIRQMESMSNNIFGKSLGDKLNNIHFIANGLGPVTAVTKIIDGLVRGHTIIEASMRLVGKGDKPISDFERTFLARYGITEDLANRISDMPFEKTKNGLFLPNTEKWTDDIARDEFRNALSSGVLNRVIMGTPADKPSAASGFFYIPESIGAPLGLPKDPLVKGYRRVESGLLSLPFTFYSYSMGALTKITGNHASGAVRNPMIHFAAAFGMGYLIVKARTPEYVWSDMDADDKIARAFDFSGLAAIYTDMAYRGISAARDFGIENTGPIEPKYTADPDPFGAVVSLGGAPADWSYDMIKAVKQMVDGEMTEGAKSMIRLTPLIENLAVGKSIKDLANEVANELPNRP